MLHHHFIDKAGILVLKPDGELSKPEIAALRQAVETYLADHKDIRGLLIDAQSFPGYEGVSAFVSHVKFVAEFHKKVEKVALVSDAKFAELAELMAKTFVHQNFRHFPYADRDAALAWLSQS